MPDGSSFTYVSTYAYDEDYTSQLFFQKIDDGNPKQFTFHKGKDNHPRFSPDGKKLVFQSTRSGLPQLWLLHTDGGEAEQLTTFKNGAVNPYWSKDGKSLIFTASLEK